MAGQNPLLTFSAGALVGGLVTYAAVTTAQASVPARKTKKKADTSDSSSGPKGLPGKLQQHREPIVGPLPLPETTNDLRVLDRIICEVFRTNPALSEELVLFTTEVFTRIVGVEGPTVVGDHPSLVKVEAIIEFRILQMALSDETQTPRQNFNRLCPVEGDGIGGTPQGVGG